MAAHDEERRRPATPEEMVEAGRAMMDAEPQEPSVEVALQLRHKLEEKAAAKQKFLDCNSLSDLPAAALAYVESAEAARTAARVVANEAGLYEREIRMVPADAIVTRG